MQPMFKSLGSNLGWRWCGVDGLGGGTMRGRVQIWPRWDARDNF